jgi:hypothetical protein
MTPRRVLVIDDFQPRGSYIPNRWIAVPPLDALLAENTAAVLVAAHSDYLARCYDEGWMDGCEVPLGLSISEIQRYLENPVIAVDRTQNRGISAMICFNTKWDPEHGLYLEVVDGRVTRTEP